MNRKDWFTACSAVEKEALYRAELENYSEKLVVNGEGRIVFINEKYAAEFGKTPADIEGMTMAELFSRIKAPVILDIRDFDIPFIPHVDAVPGKSDGYIPIFIRSPLMDEKGAHVGDMIYDGQTWLRRYRGLYDKLNELVDEYQYLHAAKRSNTNARFVGSSTAVVQLKREILLAAKTNATLLIEGETGTGKEVVANEVFSASARSGKRFVTLNCAAIPQELIESELFGYEEGAFTGARRGGKLGLFELANEGVILLDEINSLSLSAQAKLLRVLQERRGETNPSPSTCGSSPSPTVPWSRWWPRAPSGRISTIGSTSFTSRCPLSGSAPRTSPTSSASSFSAATWRWRRTWTRSIPRSTNTCRPSPGRAMSASSRTGWSEPWPPPGKTC